MDAQPLIQDGVDQLHMDRDDISSEVRVLTVALYSMERVLSFFWNNGWFNLKLHIWPHELPKLLEILETELGLVYDYIYTKAAVFQTRGDIILRCISQTCFLASFLLFVISNKQRYNSIDTAVTYALFAGGFFLEVCARDVSLDLGMAGGSTLQHPRFSFCSVAEEKGDDVVKFHGAVQYA